MTSPRPQRSFPDNPVLVRFLRGREVESVHRGAWCLVDPAGEVLAGAGDLGQRYFARSSVKALQALALLESGAAEHFQLSDEELAVVIASHAGEECHTAVVSRLLERLGLGVRHLRCGVHAPFDERTRKALRAAGETATALHNNCSGKHVGFLALAKHLGVPSESYLDPDSAGQKLVRAALAEMSGVSWDELAPEVDGCSAPTFRLPLAALATAFARLANPSELGPARRAAAERLTRVAGAHPVLIAGSARWLDTDLLRASGGRLFAKYGAEAVQAVGVVGGGRGFALKIDDGGLSALQAFVPAILERLGLLQLNELAALASWREMRLVNFAGLDVGRIEPVLP
ncbi:MAG: asparaginase [Planctomycetota bacterium]